MRRPLALSAAGWFLLASEAIPVLALALPATPPSPQVAALVAALPPAGRFDDAIWWIDTVLTVAAGVLLLRGVRAGRTLYLAWGAVSLVPLAWSLASLYGATQAVASQSLPFAITGASIHVAIYLAVAALLLRPRSSDWLALPPDRRSFPAWSGRGVLGTLLLVVGGFALYCWLLVCLIAVAVAIDQGPRLVLVVLPSVWLVPVAALLALGLAVAPGRHGGRRLALIGLCSGLFTLLVGVLCGTFLCSPAAVSLFLQAVPIPAGFGRHILLACPALLVLLVPSALRLRRSPPPGLPTPD